MNLIKTLLVKMQRIWHTLEVTHEGTSEVRKSMINLFV